MNETDRSKHPYRRHTYGHSEGREMKVRNILIVALLMLIPLSVMAGEKEDQLIKAAEDGNLNGVKEMIAAGADVNARDNDDGTALIRTAWASFRDSHIEIVKALIVAGADVNARTKVGNTALMMVTGPDQTKIVETLIDAGADVNAVNNRGLDGVNVGSL